ncbi:MAG: hypothetical protein WCK34_19255, partial [Bacteroidota bacterium]
MKKIYMTTSPDKNSSENALKQWMIRANCNYLPKTITFAPARYRLAIGLFFFISIVTPHLLSAGNADINGVTSTTGVTGLCDASAAISSVAGGLSTPHGTASANKSFTVYYTWGCGAGLLVTASPYEISANGSTGWTTSISIPINTNATYYVRLASTAAVGSYSGCAVTLYENCGQNHGSSLSFNTANTVTSATATRLVITGSTSQTAGAAQSLTITAKDAGGTTITNYAGDKTLTFSGASSSTNPTTAPTVTNKTGMAVAFNSSTTITFTNGVAT